MFGNIKNLGALMQNAGQIREKMEQMRDELERKTVEGEAGGGAVRATVNGRGRVVRIDLDQTLLAGLAGDDKTMAEELITAAINDALDKVQDLVKDQVSELTGGMDIPGLSDMLGGGGGSSDDDTRTGGGHTT